MSRPDLGGDRGIAVDFGEKIQVVEVGLVEPDHLDRLDVAPHSASITYAEPSR